MKRLVFAFVLLAASCSSQSINNSAVAPPAAPGTIRGVVTDNSGNPLPGVTVMVSGSR